MVYSQCNQLIYLIMTTEVDKKNACKIANILLGEKLIPCVTFKSVESQFWWEGEINKSKEIQLIIKCKELNIKKVCKRICELHSYEIPEIIYFPVSSNENYQNWVNSF